MKRIGIIIVLIVLCCSVAVLAMADESLPAARSRESVLQLSKEEHRTQLSALVAKRRAAGWQEVDYTLCKHGGATDFNDLTLQRTVGDRIETQYFCPLLLGVFKP